MAARKATKADYILQFNQVSAKISDLLKTSGPLTLQEIQKITQESYFAISTSIGLLYQDKLITITPKEQSILITLNSR